VGCTKIVFSKETSKKKERKMRNEEIEIIKKKI